MINFIPLLDASNFHGEMEEELVSNEVSTHYQADILYIDWDDEDDYPHTKKWLVETYGEDIKNHEKFAIDPT